MAGSVMVMVPVFAGRIVCVVKVTVVVAVVACSAFWSADASSSREDWTVPTRAGTLAPVLTASFEVFTVRPAPLRATPGPVVNSPGAKVIFEMPMGKSVAARVHTMVRPAFVNVQVAVRLAPTVTGTRTPAGLALRVK